MQILFLVKYGNFSYLDCEAMSSTELKMFYRTLKEIQEKETEAIKGIRQS